jgi:hypothetical protein
MGLVYSSDVKREPDGHGFAQQFPGGTSGFDGLDHLHEIHGDHLVIVEVVSRRWVLRPTHQVGLTCEVLQGGCVECADGGNNRTPVADVAVCTRHPPVQVGVLGIHVWVASERP